jgi:hypothetical protein
MPQLDLSDIILDPLFASEFQVQRRAEVINNFGENNFQTWLHDPVWGVVAPVSPSDLARMPDAQIDRKTISIVTKFRLQLATPGYQADLVIWHRDTYVVISVRDWSSYGAGFIEAVAQSMDLIQAPVRPPV